MDIKTANASLAYSQALARATSLEGAAGAGLDQAGPSFAELLGGVAENAVGAVKAGEATSLASLGGNADLVDIVTAVGNAEVTLQTVVAIRDRVVQAYQQILRMPI